MRNVLILVAATALGGCPAETQSTCSGAVVNGRCAESVCGEAGVRADGYCNDDPSAPVRVPRHERKQIVQTEKAIDGFEVVAIPAGATGWGIRVTSKIDAVASVVLDESTFVKADGNSAGRLISGDTRKIDTAKAQPSLPVAPGASINQFVIPEKLIEDEEAIARIEQRRVPQGQLPRIEAMREKEDAEIVGGKLYVTVSGPNGKQTWTGVVRPPAGGE